MTITLKQLEYFVAAGDHGSIKRAATTVNISQPSISSAVSQLEDELQLQLFVRHHAQGLSLTTAGKLMMRESKLLLKQVQGFYSIAAEINDKVSGNLKVGCMVTLAPMIAPELGFAFTAEHPQARLEIIEGSHHALIADLRQVKIDVAITYDLTIADDVNFQPLAELPPRVLLAKAHPLANKNEISMAELAEYPMVLLDLPQSRDYFMSLFEVDDLHPEIAMRASSQEVVRTLVANGYGFSITNVRPRNLTALDGRELASVALAGQHKPMRIGIATLSQIDPPAILREFKKHCCSLITNSCIPGMTAE